MGFIKYLFLLGLLCLQGCNHNDDTSEDGGRKADLSKAASYNIQLGLGYLKQGDRPRAKKKLLLALDQQPNSADVNAAMAYFFEQSNEMDQAKKYYLNALALSNNSGAQLNNYGTFLCRQGNYTQAEKYFMKAVQDEQYLHTSAAYENAGLCALAIPDKDKARNYFTSAINQDPSRRVSLYELVKLDNSMGKNEEAFDLLQGHPDLVLNDRIFLSLAKDVANKSGKYDVAAYYDDNLKKMEQKTGVQNEYNDNNG